MTFLALDDRTPRVLIVRPWATWGLISLCSAVFLLQSVIVLFGGEHLILDHGLVAATLSGHAPLSAQLRPVDPLVTLLTYMFLHGNGWHLALNLLFLLIFGDAIEEALGHLRFLVFFLLGGVAAGLAQVVMLPESGLPMIGASGAVAAVLGAALVLRPHARIPVPFRAAPLRVSAVPLLVLWFGFQLFMALGGAGPNIAWWAHIGGFLTGVVLVGAFRQSEPRALAPAWRPATWPASGDRRPHGGTEPSRRGPWD
ncbi:MAG TPA: rhomboid family intramembrane serine protease [Gammaproteobacteria bacterium]|nr:rhomboid family intramembrane serine protease [Gammaproteobacteria bacterium]